ncbi:MAG TPA: hypothetical protein VGK16_04095 [Candidatus Limnocylindrales bacterium]
MIIDQLNQIWTGILEFTSKFVIPAWGELINLLPLFLLIGVVGPILTILMLAWLRYGVRKPRVRAGFVDLRRAAPLDEAGQPQFPVGEPYSLAEAMIYEPGATRSVSGDELLVSCPKCGLVRSAAVDTCGNCGLRFSLTPPTRTLRPAAPPPGGRAAV